MMEFLVKDSFKHFLNFLVLVVCSKASERGVRNVSVGRIVGGFDVKIEEAPYMVSVRHNKNHKGGGALISERHVLTGAHCIGLDYDISTLSVRAGSTYYDYYGDIIDILKVDIHPKYNKFSYDFDAAVLTLVRTPKFELPISPVSIAQAPVIADENVFIAGWGVTSPELKYYNPTLKGVWLKVFSHLNCVNCYQRGAVTDNMFCAGFPEGLKDACYGDSGGPAVVFEEWLVGIISWGRSCAVAGKPGVYTKASAIYYWVKNITSAPL